MLRSPCSVSQVPVETLFCSNSNTVTDLSSQCPESQIKTFFSSSSNEVHPSVNLSIIDMIIMRICQNESLVKADFFLLKC